MDQSSNIADDTVVSWSGAKWTLAYIILRTFARVSFLSFSNNVRLEMPHILNFWGRGDRKA